MAGQPEGERPMLCCWCDDPIEISTAVEEQGRFFCSEKCAGKVLDWDELEAIRGS